MLMLCCCNLGVPWHLQMPLMDKAAASRIQSAGARASDGGTQKGTFAARAQSAADRRQADHGSKHGDRGPGYLLWPIGVVVIATLIWKAVRV